MRTLRRQLIVWLILLLTVVAIAGGTGAYIFARRESDGFFDDQLKQIARFVGDVPRGHAVANGPAVVPEDMIIVQIWDSTGQPVRLSHPEIAIPKQTTTGFSNNEANGDLWRTYGLITTDRVVQVSQRASVREQLAADSAFQAVLPILTLIPLSWLLVGGVIRHLLRPLTLLAQAVRKRPAGMSTPLSLEGLPGEVTPVVTAVNDLLEREHGLLEARQRFISDAAHQLRTPLTALRLQTENLNRARSLPEARERAEEVLLGVRRMSALTNQLLQLARADAAPKAVSPQPIGEIIKEAIAESLPLAASRGVDLGLISTAPVSVAGTREALRMMVGNLIDNAVRYTPAGGQVDVKLSAAKGSVLIEVIDTGPGIPEQHLSRVFDRFFKVTADSEGSGLGLPIAKAVAQQFGAELTLSNRRDRTGTIAAIRLPMAALNGDSRKVPAGSPIAGIAAGS